MKSSITNGVLMYEKKNKPNFQMAKPKERPLVSTPANKNSMVSSPELDLLGEESWVVVKKQKVTILIPPLPYKEKSTMANSGESQPQAINIQSQNPSGILSQMHSDCEKEKSMSLALKKVIPTASKDPQPVLAFSKQPRLNHRMRTEIPDQDGLRLRKRLGVCSTTKASKQSKSFLDGGVLLNQRMRASNLERKIQRAGGLSSWLVSLGLNQFVKIFRGRSVNKFQLVNLTTKKLKDMGADAVGPRRKLIHAIDCLCQPYCFEPPQMLGDVRATGN